MNRQQKMEAIRGLNIELLRTIVHNPRSPETEQRSNEFPLGGIVHIDGIGQVELSALRTELDRREKM